MPKFIFCPPVSSDERYDSGRASNAVPETLKIKLRGRDIGVAVLKDELYIADLPENICELLQHGAMRHYFVTDSHSNSGTEVLKKHTLKHIIVF